MRPRYVCSIRTPRARRVCSHRTCSDTVGNRREGILNENAPVSPLMQAPGALLVPGAARPGQIRLNRRCMRHRSGSSRQYRPCGSPASDAYAAYKGRSCEQGAQDGRGKSSPKHLASIGLQDPACGPRILRRERGVGPSTTYWSVSVLHRPHLLIPGGVNSLKQHSRCHHRARPRGASGGRPLEACRNPSTHGAGC